VSLARAHVVWARHAVAQLRGVDPNGAARACAFFVLRGRSPQQADPQFCQRAPGAAADLQAEDVSCHTR
jgi:hypothetical protein